MTIQIPLSQSGPADQFEVAVNAHCAALMKHQMGKPGNPQPVAHPLIESLIARQPQTGPVATRGPDEFIILPYEIIDDRPVSPEIKLLRETINS